MTQRTRLSGLTLRATILLSAAVLAFGPASVQGAVRLDHEGGATQIVAPDPASIEDAIRFRSEMGLDTSLVTVEALATTTQPSPVFGLPLTRAEEALMLERGRIQQELAPLRAYRQAHRDIWGGLWLSYPVGATLDHAVTINVALTESTDVEIESIKHLLPRGADLAIHGAQNTEDALDALHPTIATDGSFFASLGTELHSVATDVRLNVVEIVVSPLDARIGALIGSRYGESVVRVIEGGLVAPDACSRSNCGPPWLAGLKIAKPGPFYCTSNFIVRLYQGIWTYALWTAGHCGSATWKQGSTSGTTIGTTVSNYFAEGTDADVQVIPISLSQGGLDDYLYGSALCTECIKKDVRTRECKDCDEVGEIISNNGAFSGVKYGTIQNTNVTCPASDCIYTLYRQRRATYTRMGGDSGGPVTALSGGLYDVAVGSHVNYQTISGTQYAIYSHVAEMEEITGWSVWYNQ